MRRMSAKHILIAAAIVISVLLFSGCTAEPEVLELDWTLYATEFSLDGEVLDEFTFTVTGTVPVEVDMNSAQTLNLDIVWPDSFRFVGNGTEPYSGWAANGDPSENYYVANIYSRTSALAFPGRFGIAPKKGYMFIKWNDEDSYLLASTDPDTTQEELEAFFVGIMPGNIFDDPSTHEPQDGSIDWKLHGVWVTKDGQVQENLDGVDFSLSGTLPTEFEPYSTVEMELNFVWPESLGYMNEGPITYVGGANYANKHDGQSIYHGFGWVMNADGRDSTGLGFTICPEDGFLVLHIGERYIVASTYPNANVSEIFAFYQQYVHNN